MTTGKETRIHVVCHDCDHEKMFEIVANAFEDYGKHVNETGHNVEIAKLEVNIDGS